MNKLNLNASDANVHTKMPLRAAPRVSGQNEATLESAELDG
jgi:hypothetical protein